MKESEKTFAKFEVGDRCKLLNPCAFLSDEPFTIVAISICTISTDPTEFRYIYILQYDDGQLDAIPVKNEGGYEMVKVAEA